MLQLSLRGLQKIIAKQAHFSSPPETKQQTTSNVSDQPQYPVPVK